MAEEKRPVVYRFKAKVSGGEWRFVVDGIGIPVSITTDKGRNYALKIFKRRYPSIADLYIMGETLITEPDLQATNKLEILKKRKKEDEEERIRNAWWQD